MYEASLPFSHSKAPLREELLPEHEKKEALPKTRYTREERVLLVLLSRKQLALQDYKEAQGTPKKHLTFA